jgi:hypothetical protein
MHQAPITDLAACEGCAQQTPPQDATGNALQHVLPKDESASDEGDSSISDCQREAAIVNAGREIEEHMRAYGESGDFTDRAAADAARLRMEALIRGRSAGQVARMEQERGLE